MLKRRSIAEHFDSEFPPDVLVGDDAGNQTRAAIDPVTRVSDLSDIGQPDLVQFVPTCFEVAEEPT